MDGSASGWSLINLVTDRCATDQNVVVTVEVEMAGDKSSCSSVTGVAAYPHVPVILGVTVDDQDVVDDGGRSMTHC